MTGAGTTRRGLLASGAAAAAVAAGAGVAAPPARGAALSATDGERLVALLRAESDALYAYGSADRGVAGELIPRTREHVAVLTTQLAAYGLGPYASTTSAAALGPHARAAAAATERAAFLDAAVALEDGLADAYAAAVPGLQQPDTLMTAAMLLAAHAQLTVWLGRLAVT